jgi:PadR family transcriptional regulator, regulatory protein PadR
MNCKQVEERDILEGYLLDRLSEAERDEFELHYFECESCFSQLETERMVQAELQSQPKSHAMTQKKAEAGDLLRDTLEMLILKTLTRGEMHGYDIAEYIRERSDQVLGVEEGALYPALHSLEVRGLLAAEWGTSDNNRRAKYYRLTAAGRKQLAEETAHWKRTSAAIARILEPA